MTPRSAGWGAEGSESEPPEHAGPLPTAWTSTPFAKERRLSNRLSHPLLRLGAVRRYGGTRSRKGSQLSVQMENQGPETGLRPWVSASTHTYACDKALGLQLLSHQPTE